jgi:uncharacterized delta-60 repeat protein
MKSALIALFIVCLLLFVSYSSSSQPGMLDQTFGNGGKVLSDYENGFDECHSLALYPDGKIIAVGYANTSANGYQLDINMYKQNGTLDSAFADNGKLVWVNGLGQTFGNSVLLQADGKIVVGGKVAKGTNDDFLIGRFEAAGYPDFNFGVGGFTNTEFNQFQNEECNAIALDKNENIIAVGTASNNVALARYTSFGILDNTFGSNGKVQTIFSGGLAWGKAVAIQPNGKILVAGYFYNSNTDYDFTLIRYNYDGTIDSTFALNGIATVDFGLADYCSALSISSTGDIVIAGTSETNTGISKIAIAKYDSTGAPVLSFGNSGKVLITLDNAAYIKSICLQPDDKIIAAGQYFNYNNFADSIILMRFLPNGNIDASFGINGKATTDFGNDYNLARSVILQTDGKILVGGYANIAGNNVSDFALARYNNDITLPISLLNFTASKKNTSVLLNWQTTFEQSDKYFAIERSGNNSNGFKEIGRTYTKENSSAVHSFEDDNPLNGKSHYRLKQVDADGKINYSKIVSVDFDKTFLIKLYPNPVKDILRIQGLNMEEKSTLSIFDLQGHLVLQASVSNGTSSINVSRIASGIYLLKIKANDKIQTLKFVKQ